MALNLKNLNKDQLISMVNKLKNENCTLQEENAQLKTQLEEIKSELLVAQNTSQLLCDRVIDLERRASSQEQYSRRECLEISGIPSNVADGHLEEKVRFILHKIDVDIPTEQIEACHRIGKNGKTIVKFSRRKDISRIFSNKKKLKNLDANSLTIPEKSRVYINESLCPSYKNLWWKCKTLWKAGKITKFFTSNGTIRIKTNQLGNSVPITHVSDLEGMFPDFDFQ